MLSPRGPKHAGLRALVNKLHNSGAFRKRRARGEGESESNSSESEKVCFPIRSALLQLYYY
jgi:hypothetical protein